MSDHNFDIRENTTTMREEVANLFEHLLSTSKWDMKERNIYQI